MWLLQETIINSDLTIKEKAQKIQDHDYRMSQKETSKPVYQGDLMPTQFIREVLERE